VSQREERELDFRKGSRWQRWLGIALVLAISAGIAFAINNDVETERDHAHAFLRAVRSRDREAILQTVTEPVAEEIRAEGLEAWVARVHPGLLESEDATLPSVRSRGGYACLSGVLHGAGGTWPISLKLEGRRVARVGSTPVPLPGWGCK
jgi:hypothetical protein